MRHSTLILLVSALLSLCSACTNKDHEIVTRKETALDTFVFTPKTAAEMAPRPASQASGPPSALDTFVFKPKTAAEMAAPRPSTRASSPPSALDTFVFKPRSAAEMPASSARSN